MRKDPFSIPMLGFGVDPRSVIGKEPTVNRTISTIGLYLREDFLTVLYSHWNSKRGKIAIKGCYLRAIKKQRGNQNRLAANQVFHFTSFKSVVALLYFTGKPKS